jgi:hypothetical protein
VVLAAAPSIWFHRVMPKHFAKGSLNGIFGGPEFLRTPISVRLRMARV